MEGKDWVELFKFPLTIITAVAAVLVASLILKVKPTDVEIGDLKFKLEAEIRRDLTNSNIDLEENIRSEIAKQIKLLQSDSIQHPSFDNFSDSKSEDVVSDHIAKIASIQTDNGTQNVFKETEGFIWIGNYLLNSKNYSKVKINIDDLSKVVIGEKYFVNGNMVIRESSPVKNVDYFHGVKKIGLASRGTEIQILEAPEIKKLGDYQQYWVKIKVIN